MRKYIIGALVGSALTMASAAGAAAVKQYILTEAAYPIVVNGKAFSDPAAPILNYEGSTYVPLARLGDLTGVNYKWNDADKRVEIVTGSTAATAGLPEENVVYSQEVPAKTEPKETITPNTKIVEPKGLVVENGETVFYAYDRDGKFKGRFTDSDNAELTIAIIDKRPILPPKTSDGWIGLGLLAKIYNNAETIFEGETLILKTPSTYAKQEEYLRLKLPEGWRSKDNVEGTANDIRLKRVDKGTYLYIPDLQKAGVLK